jgi:NadR type nicotinamide-nucleotide adenylyltransferase
MTSPNGSQPFVVGIVGPESTGKSTLASELARHYKTEFVREMARVYLEQLDYPYQFEDLAKIAAWQLKEEDQLKKSSHEIIICDTTLLVLKIWSEFKYDKCDHWILEEEARSNYDLILLTDIDLPWQEDPLREHPHERQTLFSIYYRSLIRKGNPFRVIFGTETARLQAAIRAIDGRKRLNH